MSCVLRSQIHYQPLIDARSSFFVLLDLYEFGFSEAGARVRIKSNCKNCRKCRKELFFHCGEAISFPPKKYSLLCGASFQLGRRLNRASVAAAATAAHIHN